ncbi:uncharacterized protein LOC107627534 [Arachis ipaensis]|uniref:uncharacterized protein LOC107627534 n=1 Tax=Arachis ipaensis TaxID=130454 RepID=UPI0007AF4F7A|nr:uncharacterized protein LOC107627534 [Arachis ipaensis]XP_025636181.1 uncharacterized protein LOC112730302 [Arachis hypogaea]
MPKKEVKVAEGSKQTETPKEAESIKVHAQKPQKETKDEHYSQFLEVFKKLQINIPFAKVLEQRPPYVVLMKGLLFEKKALKEDEIVVLTKEYSTLIQSKLPRKMPDPGSFQIPCTIGNITFDKALCDLSSSINLMPLSVMKKLQIPKVQATRIALKMADKSLKQAYGIVENILVKVGKLFLLADFVILDMGEDANDSIILGRPFLATGRALIHVEKGELVLRMHNDYSIFKVCRPSLHSDERGTCIRSEVSNPSLQGSLIEARQSSHFKPSLMGINVILSDIKLKFGVRILSLEHVELSHESIGKKLIVRGEDLSPYDPP